MNFFRRALSVFARGSRQEAAAEVESGPVCEDQSIDLGEPVAAPDGPMQGDVGADVAPDQRTICIDLEPAPVPYGVDAEVEMAAALLAAEAEMISPQDVAGPAISFNADSAAPAADAVIDSEPQFDLAASIGETPVQQSQSPALEAAPLTEMPVPVVAEAPVAEEVESTSIPAAQEQPARGKRRRGRNNIVDEMLRAMLEEARKRADSAVGAYEKLNDNFGDDARRTRGSARIGWTLVGMLSVLLLGLGLYGSFELSRSWTQVENLNDKLAMHIINTAAANADCDQLRGQLSVAEREQTRAQTQLQDAEDARARAEAAREAAQKARFRAETECTAAQQARARAEDELRVIQRQTKVDEELRDRARHTGYTEPPASQPSPAPAPRVDSPATQPSEPAVSRAVSPRSTDWASLLNGN